MKLKKWLCLVLVLSMAVPFAACAPKDRTVFVQPVAALTGVGCADPETILGIPENALTLDRDYVAFGEDGLPYVWAEKRGRLEKRCVTLGAYNGEMDIYEIQGGLTEEDYIALPDKKLCEIGAPTAHVCGGTDELCGTYDPCSDLTCGFADSMGCASSGEISPNCGLTPSCTLPCNP